MSATPSSTKPTSTTPEPNGSANPGTPSPLCPEQRSPEARTTAKPSNTSGPASTSPVKANAEQRPATQRPSANTTCTQTPGRRPAREMHGGHRYRPPRRATIHRQGLHPHRGDDDHRRRRHRPDLPMVERLAPRGTYGTVVARTGQPRRAAHRPVSPRRPGPPGATELLAWHARSNWPARLWATPSASRWRNTRWPVVCPILPSSPASVTPHCATAGRA